MSYEDFWFVDTRVQTTNLKRYFIYFIIIFSFVSISTYMTVNAMYNNIDILEIKENNFKIIVSEAKATNVNGYVKGEIVSEKDEEINNKYLLFLLYNEKNEMISKEYIEVGTLYSGQKKSFELEFKADKINKIYITEIDYLE